MLRQEDRPDAAVGAPDSGEALFRARFEVLSSYYADIWRRTLASDCYRFVLADPRVDVCLIGPKSDRELAEALETLERGPMDPAELEWMRAVGEHLHRNTPALRKRLMQLKD